MNYHISKTDRERRISAEQSLKGNADNIKPSKHLNARQKKIFKSIVQELESSNILSNLDIHILDITAIAIDRLQSIDKMINDNLDLYKDKDLMRLRKECINDIDKFGIHLCLSPESRAKIANININAMEQEKDPLLKILGMN